MANISPAVKPKTTVGVIVGRFQVPHLHEVHEELIRFVINNHPRAVVFLGMSPCKGTRNNPLDYVARKQMVLEKFPEVTVLPIRDQRSDDVWSKNLDTSLLDVMNPQDTATLYGGRDSFIKHYKGRFQTQELGSDSVISGSEIRNEIGKRTKSSPDFRAGVIWGSQTRFPTAFTTVDIAVFNQDYTKILLARKPDEKEYRLIGGFSTPESTSFELDARREVMEEAQIEVGDMQYIGSFLINDWRYRSEVDKIKTILFGTQYVFGSPKGSDDVEVVEWTDLRELQAADDDGVDVPIVQEHYDLIRAAWLYAAKKKAPKGDPTF